MLPNHPMPPGQKECRGWRRAGQGERDEQREVTGQGRPRSPKTVQSAEGGEGKEKRERIIVVVKSPCQENYPADAHPSAHKLVLESANPACTWSVHLDAPGLWHGQQPVSGTADPGVVKQDKSSRGSVDTTKTHLGPQRVRMSSGKRPIGAAKGKQSDTKALCQNPPGGGSKGWLSFFHVFHAYFKSPQPTPPRKRPLSNNSRWGGSACSQGTAPPPSFPVARNVGTCRNVLLEQWDSVRLFSENACLWCLALGACICIEKISLWPLESLSATPHHPKICGGSKGPPPPQVKFSPALSSLKRQPTSEGRQATPWAPDLNLVSCWPREPISCRMYGILHRSYSMATTSEGLGIPQLRRQCPTTRSPSPGALSVKRFPQRLKSHRHTPLVRCTGRKCFSDAEMSPALSNTHPLVKRRFFA